jgi:DNA-binding response OmpR family regulator
VPGERSAEEIQRDIEQARTALAGAVDQLAERTSPKRLVAQVKATVRQQAQTPAGKAVIGGAGVLVALLIIRRIRKH